MTDSKKPREWTLYSNYSTDHDAMKWYVTRDTEITPEVETPERVHVIEHSAYAKLLKQNEVLKIAFCYMGIDQPKEVSEAREALQAADAVGSGE